jgi:hypothetical protein
MRKLIRESRAVGLLGLQRRWMKKSQTRRSFISHFTGKE